MVWLINMEHLGVFFYTIPHWIFSHLSDLSFGLDLVPIIDVFIKS